ncbi:MAG: amidohydrolase family protein [Desulfobacterales bacterium]|nr:amidohydrolase family protein [Desulfobacterales bacterium]
MVTLYKGHFIDTPTPGKFRVREDAVAIVEAGKLLALEKEVPARFSSLPVTDLGAGVVIPSFIDLHVHAPQHMQMGAGLDLGLLDWLEHHTFPGESRFADEDYARKIYPLFAAELLRQGTLRSVVYGTIHPESTLILAQALEKAGLFAFVGKVNMDRNAPDDLKETTEDAFRDSELFCRKLTGRDGVRPILTPRFAPSCSKKLMEKLGQLSGRLNLPLQSHLSETLSEAQWVSELFPESRSYTHLYNDCGLLGPGSLMAHAIYLSDGEIDLIVERETTLVHCPGANVNLSSGIMPLGRCLDRGVKLGLGSDVGAGHTLAMYRAVVQTVQVSKLLRILKPRENHRTVSLSEAFYLATMGNGEFFTRQGWGPCGAFEPGMSFDALHIDMGLPQAAALSALTQLERFLYAGDDRDIKARILAGREL